MKLGSKFLLVLLALLLVLAGCSSSSKTTESGSENKNPETKEPTASTGECKVKIGLVTDTGGVDDKSFNQSAWEGLLRFAEENNHKDCIKFLQSDNDSQYIPNLSSFAEEKYDLVIAVGYLFEEAIKTVSAQFPDTNFLLVDMVVEAPNVLNAIYSVEQGSYLVGIAAGLKAIEEKTNKVGFVGGMEGPIIGAFQAGYEQGVLSVCPECTIYVDYADSYSDDTKGQQLAVKQYNNGVNVIFQAAGNAGNGVIKEAKERGNVWAIGVDKDQYTEGEKEDGTSVILTSMLKRVDTSTYDAATRVLKGTFKGEIYTFDLMNEGVGAEISTGRNLSDDIISKINEAAAKIKSGEIKVTAEPVIKNGKTNLDKE